MYFIENSDKSSILSSRYIRKNQNIDIISYDNVGNYLIRNESLLPLEKYVNELNKDKVQVLQEKFLNKFMRMLSNCFVIRFM